MNTVMREVGFDFAAIVGYIGLDRLTAAGDGLAHLAAAWLGVAYLTLRVVQVFRQTRKAREKTDPGSTD